MCLSLNKNWEEITQTYKESKEPITAWKVLEKVWVGNTGQTMEFQSIYLDFTWEKENYSSRASRELTHTEKDMKRVYEGFHFYVNKSVAQRLAKSENILDYDNHCVYVRCTIQPEDVVAVGEFAGNSSLVATKCTLHVEELPEE